MNTCLHSYRNKRRENRMFSSLQLVEQLMTLLKPFSSSSLLIILLLIPILVKWVLYKTSKPRKTLPPSPPKLPIIGNLHQLGTLPHLTLQKLSRQYGPIMSLSIGALTAYVITSPEGAREVMQTHDLAFADRPDFKVFKKLFYGMKNVGTAPYGEYWRQVKSICTLQLLSKKKVLSFQRVREEETALVMQTMKDRSDGFTKAVNLSELFTFLSMNVLCGAAFSKRFGEGEEDKKNRETWYDYFFLLRTAGTVEDYLPWLSWINYINGRNATINKVAKGLDDFLEGLIVERLARYTNGDHIHEKLDVEAKEDFLDILIRIYRDQDGPSLGRDSIKAIILDMFGGGTDTSSTLLEWAMAELLRHPGIMKKLQDEVRGIAKGEVDVKEVHLEKMYYLKAVLKETLRCHPPLPTIAPRLSRKDAKVMGYDIPIGSLMIINGYAIARDPLLWDDPDEFKPERFQTCPRDFYGRDFEFLPFGTGRRGCPGTSFALATNELALANLVHKFDWKLPNGVTKENLDMTECKAIIAHRKHSLFAIPSPASL